jgi:DNA-binding NtrC family response regulator
MQGKLIKTLILEDDPEDMLILEKIIKAVKLRDIRFSAVTKLAEAVDLLKKEKFDLVISDLTVPDSRGLETFRGLRAVAPKTPVILLTGMDDELMAIQAMREGAQDYLIKGEITASLLLRAASYAIERNTLIQERLKLIAELTDAVSRIKVLTGLLPICAGCKKIRNDKGYWEQVETYLKAHADIEFTHGFCPDCMVRLYPEFMNDKKK